MKKLIQQSRFIVMLVAMLTLSLTNALAAETKSYEELFTITSDEVVNNSTYQKYETTGKERNWIITFGGNNKSVGTNSGNRSKCTLGSYTKYAVSPVTTSATASAFVSTTSISDVSKISYTFNGGSNQDKTNVYLIYSADGTTFSQMTLTSGTQGATIKSGNAYEFAKCSGYFGLLFKATNSTGNWRIDDVNITFYKEVVPVTLSIGANGSLAAYSDAERTTLLEPKDNVVNVNPNSTVYFTATPAAGYGVDTWTGATADAQDNTKASLAVGTEAASVSVTFKSAVAGYNVTLTQPTEGTISADKTVGLAENDEVTLSYSNVTTGYQFGSWSVINDGTEEAVAVTDNKFKMPASNVTASATFAPIAVTEVQLKAATSLEVGENETLVATVLPEDALDKSLTWATADDKIATVDQSGKVIAVAAGTVNITATSTNGKVGTCAVTVTEPTPTGIFTKYTVATLVEGDYVICSGTTALKNVISGNYLSNSTVSPTNNVIENPDSSVIWHIAPSATKGYWTVYNESVNKYAASTGAKNKATLNESATDSKSLWTISGSTSYEFVNKQNAANSVNANLRYNSGYGFACYSTSTGSALTLYAKLGNFAVTKATDIQNGDIDAKANDTTVMNKTVMAGTAITLSNTPASNYKLKQYIVVNSNDNTDTVVVDANNQFIMPAYPVTVSATFESAKVLNDITITGTAAPLWKGDVFSHEGITVTANYSDGDVDVTDQATYSGYDMSTAGVQTVTVKFAEGATEKSKTYQVTVKTIANTAATAYSVDSAIKLVQAGKDLATKVYVKGVITSISGQNLNNVFVKDAGLTNSFEFYNLADGSTYKVEDLVVSDTIIGYGEMTYFAKSQIYEFKAGCTLEDRKEYKGKECHIENTIETAYTEAEAIALIDQGECLETRVYVKGVVKDAKFFDASSTYTITLENGFKFYKFYDLDSALYTSDYIAQYDTIVGFGNLTKYQATYQLDANCYLAKRNAYVKPVIHVTGVTVDETATVAVNDSVQLTAVIAPANADNKNVTWSIVDGDEAYASVSATGMVKGLTVGTAKVKVETVDGNFKDTCVVTVTAGDTRKTATITSFSTTSGALTPSDITYVGGKGTADPVISGSYLRIYQAGGYVKLSAVPGCTIDEVRLTTGTGTYDYTALNYNTDGSSTMAQAENTTVNAGETYTIKSLNSTDAYIYCWGAGKNYRLDVASIVVKYTGDPKASYTIGKAAMENGDVTVVTSAYATSKVTMKPAPAYGYGLATLTVFETDNESNQVTVDMSDYSFTMPEFAVTVAATFQEVEKVIFVAKAVGDGKYYAMKNVAGSAKNSIGALEVDGIVNGKVVNVAAEDQASITWFKQTVEGGVAFTDGYGNYLSAVNSTDLNLSTTPCAWVWDEENGYYKISGSTRTFLYNNGGYFKNYGASNIGTSAYSSAAAIGTQFVEGTFATLRDSLTVGKYGTLCYPYELKAGDFAGFEAFKTVESDGKSLTIESVEALEAGKAYIIVPTAEAMTCVFTGDPATAPVAAEDNGGLTGTFEGTSFQGDGSQYVVANNKIMKAGNVTIGANKGWIIMSEVAEQGQGAPQRPGSRRVSLASAESQVVTGLEGAYYFEQVGVQKAVINGQMIIIRDGKMFNAQGQIVK